MALDITIAWAISLALHNPRKRSEIDKPDIYLLTNYLEQCRRLSIGRKFTPTFTDAQMRRVYYVARRHGIYPLQDNPVR